MISRLYDKPGTYLIDHPETTTAVKKIVKAMKFVATGVVMFMLFAAPGGVKEYKHPTGTSVITSLGPHEGGEI